MGKPSKGTPADQRLKANKPTAAKAPMPMTMPATMAKAIKGTMPTGVTPKGTNRK